MNAIKSNYLITPKPLHYNKTSAAYLQSKTTSTFLKKISYIALSALLALVETLRNGIYFLLNCAIAPINCLYRLRTPEKPTGPQPNPTKPIDAEKIKNLNKQLREPYLNAIASINWSSGAHNPTKPIDTEEIEKEVEKLNQQLRKHQEKQIAKIKELNDECDELVENYNKLGAECNELDAECDGHIEAHNKLVEDYNKLDDECNKHVENYNQLATQYKEVLGILKQDHEQQVKLDSQLYGITTGLIASLVYGLSGLFGYYTLPTAAATGIAAHLWSKSHGPKFRFAEFDAIHK